MKSKANKKSVKPVKKMTGKAMRTSKGGAGVSFGEITITKTVDKASPTLFL